MDLNQLYLLLKRCPRDGRWLLRKLGPDYLSRIEDLRLAGRPVEMRVEEVDGAQRAVYRAADQAELFGDEMLSPPRRRRRRRRPRERTL